jgi:hypothetical protein
MWNRCQNSELGGISVFIKKEPNDKIIMAITYQINALESLFLFEVNNITRIKTYKMKDIKGISVYCVSTTIMPPRYLFFNLSHYIVLAFAHLPRLDLFLLYQFYIAP